MNIIICAAVSTPMTTIRAKATDAAMKSWPLSGIQGDELYIPNWGSKLPTSETNIYQRRLAFFQLISLPPNSCQISPDTT